MAPWKYYADIPHRDHILCNPLSSGTVDEILGRLDLAPGARVLEIACGKAEMLVRLVERYQISGIGVDPSPYSIRDTQARAAERYAVTHPDDPDVPDLLARLHRARDIYLR